MQSSIVEKLLKILTLVSEAKKPYTFSELVSASGLNKSTLHRLLALSLENETLQFDARQKTYLLGPKLFELVKGAYHGYDIQLIALDEMIRLNRLTDENVTIGVPLGSDTVYLRALEASHSLGSIPQPGMREPFHCSASGKALTAFLPDSAIGAKLAGHTYEQFTPRTIVTPAQYWKAIEAVRLAGFATNDREEYEHFVGISAPIFNYLSEPIAVLNIWSLHQRCPIDKLSLWAEELMASTGRLTGLIGGSSPLLDKLAESNAIA